MSSRTDSHSFIISQFALFSHVNMFFAFLLQNPEIRWHMAKRWDDYAQVKILALSIGSAELSPVNKNRASTGQWTYYWACKQRSPLLSPQRNGSLIQGKERLKWAYLGLMHPTPAEVKAGTQEANNILSSKFPSLNLPLVSSYFLFEGLGGPFF